MMAEIERERDGPVEREGKGGQEWLLKRRRKTESGENRNRPAETKTKRAGVSNKKREEKRLLQGGKKQVGERYSVQMNPLQASGGDRTEAWTRRRRIRERRKRTVRRAQKRPGQKREQNNQGGGGGVLQEKQTLVKDCTWKKSQRTSETIRKEEGANRRNAPQHTKRNTDVKQKKKEKLERKTHVTRPC